MSANRLLTSEEAATLWGCTRRHIQMMAEQGRLPVAQVVNRVAGNSFRPARLFHPAEVLKCRAESRKNATARGIKVARLNFSRTRLRDTAIRLSKVWHSLPREERAKHSRRWMAHASHVARTAKLRGPTNEL